MQYDYIKVELDEAIMVLTIARPEVLNAIHPGVSREIGAAFELFERDPSQHVAIITGEGDKAFSSGNDLKYQSSNGEGDRPRVTFGGITDRPDFKKPVIAAVNGLAFGGGFEIALACDIIVAADHATFALPEPRVGLAAVGGGLLRLPRAIGLNRAMEIILTSRHVGAEEGRQLGFVNHVVPRGSALGTAKDLARTITGNSQYAVRAARSIARANFHKALPQAMKDQWEDPEFKAMLASPDVVEGPLAFAEKRAPRWTNVE